MSKNKIQPVSKKDLKQVLEILKTWIRFQGIPLKNETNETYENVKKSLTHKDGYSYFVMFDGNKVVGMIGLRPPGIKLSRYVTDKSQPIEMLNLFLTKESLGKSLEIELINYAHEQAKKMKATSVWWDSGPRYKETHWPIYTKHFGKPSQIAKSFYDEYETMIWNHYLKSNY